MEVEVEAAENEDDNQSVFPILNACCFRGNCVKTGEMKRFSPPLSSIQLFFLPVNQVQNWLFSQNIFLIKRVCQVMKILLQYYLEKGTIFWGFLFQPNIFHRARNFLSSDARKKPRKEKKTRNETVPVLLYRPMIDYIFARDTIQT